MDWFERLTGFRETHYDDTRANLRVEGDQLRSLVNGKSYSIGELDLVSLQTLRERARLSPGLSGKVKMEVVTGDIRRLHQSPEFQGALFQVASQFNLLEMASPEITPEHGVTRYQHDGTQGPACAIAAGAATIYRNYFVPVDGEFGQAKERQLDGLAAVGAFLAEALGERVQSLWTMRNGYALCSRTGLTAIARHLASLTPHETDALRGLLRVGVHRNVEVTDADEPARPVVSQAFCSALPVAYSDVPAPEWKTFATLVLESAYEATLLATVDNARRGGANIVLLTRLGGGAFGNAAEWIDAATRRAIQNVRDLNLNVKVVSHGPTPRATLELVKEFS